MDRARQLFQEGVWADPRSPSTVYLFHAWGALEWSAGNAGTARELFKAAIRVSGVGCGLRVHRCSGGHRRGWRGRLGPAAVTRGRRG